MSLTDITVRVAIVCGLALGALLVLGWRKPARGSARVPRPSAGTEAGPDLAQQARRTILGVSALGGIAVMAGVLVALVVSLSLSWVVTSIIDRL